MCRQKITELGRESELTGPQVGIVASRKSAVDRRGNQFELDGVLLQTS